MKQNALCELCGTCSQARSQPEIFGEQGQIMVGKNFLLTLISEQVLDF